MNSKEILNKYGQEVYFFILKKVNSKNVANDVFQNSFLKIHSKIHQLKEEHKARAWLYQIVRNEIANYFNKEKAFHEVDSMELKDNNETYWGDICCFDDFINDLPENYKEVIELTYLSGKTQEQVAELLGLSVANVKARIRRSKALLKIRFQECCKYKIDSKGNLTGTPDCSKCV